MNLQDRFGRTKRKLRISLTDRCNFRCHYCMPDNPTWLPRDELLTRDELLRVAGLFVRELGITHIRLTGGEPLLRKDLVAIVQGLNALRPQGLQRISLTTNGVLLPKMLPALIAAGLDNVNISIDAVDAARFHSLTGGDLQVVLAGIAAVQQHKLPLKLNAVVMRGENDDQIVPLTQWAVAQGIPLRFIEFMPLDGQGGWTNARVITRDDILAMLAPYYQATPLPRDNAPAAEYQLTAPGVGDYRLGIIPTVSEPFCARCDRVRLTSTGSIYNCLFATTGRDLRQALRDDVDDAHLLRLIQGEVWKKERGFAATKGYVERPLTMHALGG